MKIVCVCVPSTNRPDKKRTEKAMAGKRGKENERLTLTIRYSLAIYFAFCDDIVVKLFFFEIVWHDVRSHTKLMHGGGLI